MKPTWAAVVRSGGHDSAQDEKLKEMELRIKEMNKRKEVEKLEAARKEKQAEEDVVRGMQQAITTAAQLASEYVRENNETEAGDVSGNVSDGEILNVIDGNVENTDTNVIDNHSVELAAFSDDVSDLSVVFGPGATLLANEHQGDKDASLVSNGNNGVIQDTSTPERLDPKVRRRPRHSGGSSFSSPSPVRPPQLDNDSKKLRLDSETDSGGSSSSIQVEDGLSEGLGTKEEDGGFDKEEECKREESTSGQISLDGDPPDGSLEKDA